MGFAAYKEDRSELFNTQTLTYGLLASGNLAYFSTWPRYQLSSLDLNPNDPANYSLVSGIDGIMGFSVKGCITPIAFIEGPGMYVGSTLDGDITTFLYMMANESTKCYVFDSMRDFPISAGLKCYADNESNDLTFNSAMVPLNVVSQIQYPPPVVDRGYVTSVFSPSSSRWWVRYYPTGTALLNSRRFVSVGDSTYAAASTFTRFFGQGRMYDTYPSGPGGGAQMKLAYSNGMSAIDGCYGTQGGIYLSTCDAPRCPMVPGATSNATTWFSVPTDRYPSAIIIDTAKLPFPYEAGQ